MSEPEAESKSQPAARPSATQLLLPLRRTEAGLFLAILAVVVLTTVLDSQHNYLTNPRLSVVNILRQTAMLGIFSLGAAIVIIAGGIDLSFGSVIAFSGSMCATLMVLLAPQEMKNALPVGQGTIALAIAGTLIIGFLIGSFHAWLITVVGLPPFVATLATLVGLRSFARAIVENVTTKNFGAKTTQIQIFDRDYRYLAVSVWIPVVLFILLAAGTWVLMSRTVIGRHLHALGGNEQAARLSGIQTDRLKWLAYCISAVLSSIAGILIIGETSVAEPQTLGLGYELSAIAAAVVGGCSLQGGVGTIPGTVLGVLFLRVVIDGVSKVIKTGADVYEGLIVGGVVVVAVTFSQLRQAGRRGRRFFSGPLGIVTVVNLALFAGAIGALFGPKTALGENHIGGFAALVMLVLLLLVRYFEGKRGEGLPR
jgi:ribose/xylose/arabinose/galactoside ABC-type transport system permease subunit